jgi:pantoate--beta-alanine ligase
MVVVKNVRRLRAILSRFKARGKTIGFVPTMGALHDGHVSLVKRALTSCDAVVVSVFVNPLQFGPKEDLNKYPRMFSADEKRLRAAGAHIVYYPPVSSMYSDDFSTFVEETVLSKPFCGALRPGHFRGVTTVVAKLFNQVQPDTVFFGAKDYQQALVITKMVDDLDFPIVVKVCPTVRERSGLAMSSRNGYLTPDERREAAGLYQALTGARNMIVLDGVRSASRVLESIYKRLARINVPHGVEYAQIRDAYTLEDVSQIKRNVVIALAVYIGKTRLIDNIFVTVKG